MQYHLRPMQPAVSLVACGLALVMGCTAVPWTTPSLKTMGRATNAPRRDSTPPIKGGELSPNESAEACIAAARELEQHGRWREAIVMYERARSFRKDAPGTARRLAVLYERQDDMEQARREYARALAESPKDADLLNDYGYFHYQRDDLTAAEQTFREVLKLDPANERAWINLGLVLGSQRRYEESFEAFARVVSPGAAHSNVGMVLARQGQFEQAHAAFRQALALEPSLKQPRAMLAHLENRAQRDPAAVNATRQH